MIWTRNTRAEDLHYRLDPVTRKYCWLLNCLYASEWYEHVLHELMICIIGWNRDKEVLLMLNFLYASKWYEHVVHELMICIIGWTPWRKHCWLLNCLYASEWYEHEIHELMICIIGWTPWQGSLAAAPEGGVHLPHQVRQQQQGGGQRLVQARVKQGQHYNP